MNIGIKILGSASGLPTKGRNTASVLIRVNGHNYLFDAGEPCSVSLLRNGVQPCELDAVFISHLHADHFGGVSMLIQFMQLTNRRRPFYLYMPGEGIKAVKEYLDALYLMKRALPFRLHIKPVKTSGWFYEDKNIKVRAFLNSHLTAYRKLVKKNNRMESYSYLIETIREDKRIVYTGDIRKTREMVKFFDGIDFLIQEASHVKPDEIFKFISDKKPAKVLLTHFHPKLEGREKFLLKEAKNKAPHARITLARDNMSMNI